MTTNKITYWSLMGMVLVALFVIGYGAARMVSSEESNQSNSRVKIRLDPQNSSDVHGAAKFENIASGGTEISLQVDGLRERSGKQGALYLAHVHSGTCAQGEEGEEADHDSHKGTAEGEIEFPLSPIDPDSQGKARSVTILRNTSLDELFSRDPKHINVHAAGSGDPPVLTCGDLGEGEQ